MPSTPSDFLFAAHRPHGRMMPSSPLTWASQAQLWLHDWPAGFDKLREMLFTAKMGSTKDPLKPWGRGPAASPVAIAGPSYPGLFPSKSPPASRLPPPTAPSFKSAWRLIIFYWAFRCRVRVYSAPFTPLRVAALVICQPAISPTLRLTPHGFHS